MMQFFNPRLAGVCAMAGLIALPAGASAHPSVYSSAAKVLPAGPVPPDREGLTTQMRYVVANHGYTFVLRESNAQTVRGMLDYKVVPGAYRSQEGFTKTRLLSEADTGAQAHATCDDVDALAAESAILGWQDADPFYNYVPFQATAAGLDDDPAMWLDDVEALTGLALTPDTDLAAACTGLGGTLVPADATQSSNASFNSGALAHAMGPLEDEIDALEAEQTALETVLYGVRSERDSALTGKSAAERRAADAESALASRDGELAAARAEITRLRLAAQGVRLTMTGATLKEQTLTVTGPPGLVLSLRVLISRATAKSLRLRSRLVSSGRVTIGSAGSATAELETGRLASQALRRLGDGVNVTADAMGKDRWVVIGGRLSR